MSDAQIRTPSVSGRFDEKTGIAWLILDMPNVNIINESFGTGLSQAVDWAQTQSGLKGIVIGSAHKDFCAGADLDSLFAENDAATLHARVVMLSSLYRRIETLPVPVVAALTGSALGGGYELALACHHRIALDNPSIKIGLPEVQLGLMPGAGGTQRLPRLIGIQAALEQILQGAELRPAKAKSLGMVDALAPDKDALHAMAEAFIAAHAGIKQPWDKKNATIPGAAPGSEDARNMFMAAAGMLRKKTAGVYKGPELALSAVEEGLMLTLEGGLRVEARYFTQLAVGAQAKDMLSTIWFGRMAALRHEGLPSTDHENIERVAILGAGMMGAGLAFVCAKAGYQVVIKDVRQEALEAGKKHFDEQLAKLRHLSGEQRAEIAARLRLTLDAAAVGPTDLVIEAVFENLELKHKVNREIEPHLVDSGIWASNTSALPITELAASSSRPKSFIGLHFFSPVEAMPLVEIITWKECSQETLARSLSFCRRINKLPIVVNDGYGFYTTRVFSSYILEGAQLVAEGHDPVLIEWAARQSGMVVPPLQVFDEVTLTLGIKAMSEGQRYIGDTLPKEGIALIKAMVEQHNRPSKAAGAGFYSYEKGKRVGLWPGLRELAQPSAQPLSVEGLAERLLLVQANQAAHCLGSGILSSARDGDVGGIFGIGFAPNSGGPFRWMDRQGIGHVVERLTALASAAGPRFAPPQLLLDMAKQGKRFYPA